MSDSTCTFVALTVLFETSPSESPTLQSLAQCLLAGYHVQCVVWDNSATEAHPAQRAWLTAALPDSDYRHTPANLALSRIYNRIIEEYFRGERHGRSAALVILDQDSEFGPNLFDEASSALRQQPDVSLFLPHVIANGTLVSPADMYGCIGWTWKERRPGRVRSRFTTGINSGMIVRGSYLAARFPGYDERLRFYGTDNDFCRTYAKTERWMYALGAVVRHSLSRDSERSVDDQLWRHRENVRAILVVAGKGFLRRAACLLYCAAYCVKKAIEHRDLRFLAW